MKQKTACLFVICFGLMLILAAGCAAPAPTSVTVESPMPTVIPTKVPPLATTVPTPIFENRSIELEWPTRLRLGESDVLRLALIPGEEGYTARAEFEEHTLESKEVSLKHHPGYSLYGIARLDGVGFEISPTGDQRRMIPVGELVAWRWSLAPQQPGKQRLTVSLTLRWEPDPGTFGPVGESLVFGSGLNVDVASQLGINRSVALWLGILSLLCGGVLGIMVLVSRQIPPVPGLQSAQPNRRLVIERKQAIPLSFEEQNLLRGLFTRYSRVILENEFLSGYSGARAILVLPIRDDGQADAATIVKINLRKDILAEFQNYETYVKDRLPPVTARIQQPPVSLRGGKLAALQYTLIAEPGQMPRSLRQVLLEKSNHVYLEQMMQTFGPHWWMQRKPYTFILNQEYDRLLPPHWLLEPVSAGKPRLVLGRDANVEIAAGEIVRLGDFPESRLRTDRISWALSGQPTEGHPALRLRWMNAEPPKSGALGRVAATRMDLLASCTVGFERFDLPDPLKILPALLKKTIVGTRSTIHGDLNLENILVGPGNLVWLIDFAQTREGHSLFDFAHLAVEIAAHILAPKCGSPQAFYDCLISGDEMLSTVAALARRCQFDSSNPEEFYRPLVVTSLGALKYPNLSDLSKQCLYLLAAYYSQFS